MRENDVRKVRTVVESGRDGYLIFSCPPRESTAILIMITRSANTVLTHPPEMCTKRLVYQRYL